MHKWAFWHKISQRSICYQEVKMSIKFQTETYVPPLLPGVSPYAELQPETPDDVDFDDKKGFWDFCIASLSPKQALRPDPVCSSVFAVLPSIESMLSGLVTRVEKSIDTLLFGTVSEIMAQAEQNVARFESLCTALSPGGSISDEEKSGVSALLSEMIYDPNFIQDLNRQLDTEKKERMRTFAYLFRIMLKADNQDVVKVIDQKLDRIQSVMYDPAKASEFPVESKITPTEYGLLCNAEKIAQLLQSFSDAGLTFTDMVPFVGVWSQLARLYDSPVIHLLKGLAYRHFAEGDILLVDRLIKRELSHSQFKPLDIAKHIVGGKLTHAAIYVRNQSGTPCLSHVNIETHHHSLKEIYDPLLFQFYPSLKLNITTLIPECVSVSDKLLIQEHFRLKFAELARIEHPEIPLAQVPTYCKVVFCGHGGLSKNRVNDPDFDTVEGELCSSYVAKIFLKALVEVNGLMTELGYKEKVSCPVGEYEILERIDILQLLYHWNRHNIATSSPVDPIIEKVLQVGRK